MTRWTAEMREVIAQMMDSATYDCETACDTCPFADRCGRDELWWGCGVWEDQMGEDL